VKNYFNNSRPVTRKIHVWAVSSVSIVLGRRDRFYLELSRSCLSTRGQSINCSWCAMITRPTIGIFCCFAFFLSIVYGASAPLTKCHASLRPWPIRPTYVYTIGWSKEGASPYRRAGPGASRAGYWRDIVSRVLMLAESVFPYTWLGVYRSTTSQASESWAVTLFSQILCFWLWLCSLWVALQSKRSQSYLWDLRMLQCVTSLRLMKHQTCMRRGR